MKWMTYLSPADQSERIGVVADGQVFGCASADRLLDLLGDDGGRLAEAGAASLADPREVLQVSLVDVQAPIPVPPSFRDFMAFEDHIVPILRARGATVDPAWYQIPAFYFTNPAATQGPSQDVKAAPEATDLDYELEIAAVIGRSGRNVTPAAADALIAGYMLLSDWSARDLQRRERGIGLGPAKGKDWASSFGPLFVTADEFEPFRKGNGFDIGMRAWVNGREYSNGNLSELYWSFGEMISYASRGTEVRPGDVIGSGTVGTGCIADLSARHGIDEFPWLVPGDVVKLEADLLGAITVTMRPADPIASLR